MIFLLFPELSCKFCPLQIKIFTMHGQVCVFTHVTCEFFFMKKKDSTIKLRCPELNLIMIKWVNAGFCLHTQTFIHSPSVFVSLASKTSVEVMRSLLRLCDL